MPIVMSINKTSWLVDDQGQRHKPFTPVEITPRRLAHLAQQRHVYEVNDLIARVSAEWPIVTVRQLARNMGLDASGDEDALRARVLARIDPDAFAPEVKTVLTSPPAAPPVAPPQPPEDEDEEDIKEPSAPLVPDEALADGAWEALASAYEAQDFKAARSALAALTDEPTPAKAVELWPVVETTLRERGLLS